MTVGMPSYHRLGFVAAVSTLIALVVAAPSIASEEVERGKSVYRACASCHQVGANAKNTVGPHLNGVFGRRAGSVPGVRYSDDMKRSGDNGLTWDAEKLDIYLENPRNLISKTRMQFRGIASAEDRAAVIAYLRTFSANPRDIPEAAPTAEAVSHDPAVNPEILKIQGDPAFGEYLAGECVTCHQPSGTDRGIPSIVGWPKDAFVTAMHAYRSKTREHPVMRMIAAPLSDEEIASLAAYFETLNDPQK